LNWATWTADAAPAAYGATRVRATSSKGPAVTSVQHSAAEDITVASLNMVQPSLFEAVSESIHCGGEVAKTAALRRPADDPIIHVRCM
jgi:hypothetical protein